MLPRRPQPAERGRSCSVPVPPPAPPCPFPTVRPEQATEVLARPPARPAPPCPAGAQALPLNGDPWTVVAYVATILLFALATAWPAPCCNNPVFAEIVPPEQRTLVYAFDRWAGGQAGGWVGRGWREVEGRLAWAGVEGRRGGERFPLWLGPAYGPPSQGG